MRAKSRRQLTLLHCIVLVFASFFANPALANSNSKRVGQQSNSGPVVPVNPGGYVEHHDKFP
jgi:hypothetical protein